ncbi:oxidoreductase [Flavobacterium sp. CAU 1735]|uniref:WD40/YVTN/BNR-like repeat-containing protein n=1 Tax=Flavobacterium sp. CAU 1735 TaxID=3140361 RepID=UPI003260E11E
MKIRLLLFTAFICFSCNKLKPTTDTTENNGLSVTLTNPNAVTIDTLLTDKISIRAITVDSNRIWYAGSNGKYGYVALDGSKAFKGHIEKNDLKPEFRSSAQTKEHVFMVSIGNPGLLYRIDKSGSHVQLVYEEKGEKVFYDSMQFWNDQEGIVVGDPTDGCFSLLITRDGGTTWTKIGCDQLPGIADGEAFFAASNTNIIVKENNTWVVSGGKRSRVFFSPDKGKSWKVVDTPIVQGEAMTGIFSADFYDKNTGFAIGGNYEKPNQNHGNKIRTTDGGKTWQKVADNKGFGYGSCVQFFPGSNGRELLTVGASGVYYSADFGEDWQKIADYKDLFTIRFVNRKTVIAAGNNKILRFRF